MSVRTPADPTVAVAGQFELPLAQIRAGWEATIPAVLAS